MARQLHKVAIPPAPDPEALRARGQGRAYGASQAIPSGPWTAPSTGIQRRLSEGWPGLSPGRRLPRSRYGHQLTVRDGERVVQVLELFEEEGLHALRGHPSLGSHREQADATCGSDPFVAWWKKVLFRFPALRLTAAVSRELPVTVQPAPETFSLERAADVDHQGAPAWVSERLTVIDEERIHPGLLWHVRQLIREEIKLPAKLWPAMTCKDRLTECTYSRISRHGTTPFKGHDQAERILTRGADNTHPTAL